MRTEAQPANDTGEAGFTLIEVMVVVLIIGILLGIGIPTFLGARERAQDRAVQSNLATARSEITIEMLEKKPNNYDHRDSLYAAAPEHTWVWYDDLSTGPDVVSVTTFADSGVWAAASLSDSGTCFLMWQLPGSGVAYGTTTADQCSAFWAQRLAKSTSW